MVPARLYVSGLGYVVAYVDGNRVTPARLEPGWTSYGHRVPYVAHDVTDMLQAAGGVNHTVGLALGESMLRMLVCAHSCELRQGTAGGPPCPY